MRAARFPQPPASAPPLLHIPAAVLLTAEAARLQCIVELTCLQVQ